MKACSEDFPCGEDGVKERAKSQRKGFLDRTILNSVLQRACKKLSYEIRSYHVLYNLFLLLYLNLKLKLVIHIVTKILIIC